MDLYIYIHTHTYINIYMYIHFYIHIYISIFTGSVQFSIQSCLTLCDPINCSTPGLRVHHQLSEFTQTHVHRVSDAIQPSHPQSSLSPTAPNPSQHQSLFQWVNSSHEVAISTGVSALASFLPKKSQGWSPSEWTGWISLQSQGLSRVFFDTTLTQTHMGLGELRTGTWTQSETTLSWSSWCSQKEYN